MISLTLLQVFILQTTCLFNISSFLNTQTNGPPIILIPGLGGSRLEMKLSIPMGHYCYNPNKNWSGLWVDIKNLYHPKCFLHYLSMKYNKNTKRYQNQEGVKIRPVAFGGLEGIRYLSKRLRYATLYFEDLVQYIEALGYKEGVNFFGAPYDFRVMGDKQEFDPYFEKLTDLIEYSVKKNEKKAVLVTHSMGGPLISRFLKVKSTEWKDKYIELWYSINGAFAGTCGAVETALYGHTIGLLKLFINPKVLNQVQKTLISSYYMFPSKEIYKNDAIIAKFKNVTYNSQNITELVKLFNISHAEAFFDNVEEVWTEHHDLGVNFHCQLSDQIKTLKTIYFDDNLRYNHTKSDFGDGDGTVSTTSLEACKKFKSKMHFSKFSVLHKVSHSESIQTHETFLGLYSYLKDL